MRWLLALILELAVLASTLGSSLDGGRQLVDLAAAVYDELTMQPGALLAISHAAAVAVVPPASADTVVTSSWED